MDLKKICIAIGLVAAVLLGIVLMKDKSPEKDKTALDYTAIEKVHDEMESMKNTSMLKKGGAGGQWNVYELGLMYEKDDEFFKKLRNDLGEDFHWKLSNGDSIFIGVLPHNNSYRIYAGTPDDNHMLYPDWTYTALEKK
ncbi:hypothetical protein [Ruminococcus sp. XPD3002]|uniref:hypothetical protein n=1 Tax=Ruminococcus sp. XPD3002 TaxID=1452269 RepID=UPI0009212F3F|nr:hypothetical protein SAMN04487832_10770 [Ruminococcus flavefaciens]HPY84020.1 hypothetical protein [Ruminococcus flavefaciens]HRU96416.1 hypothetical protein [Ruminococcus sp.]